MTSSSTDASQAANEAAIDVLARYHQERADLLRQVDLLKLEVERHRKEAELAVSQAAMLASRLERHLARCEWDVAAVQRLRAELDEANSRRKEQAAVIKRREDRIVSLLSGEVPASHTGPEAKPGWPKRA